jgi:hypothetical protein
MNLIYRKSSADKNGIRKSSNKLTINDIKNSKIIKGKRLGLVVVKFIDSPIIIRMPIKAESRIKIFLIIIFLYLESINKRLLFKSNY